MKSHLQSKTTWTNILLIVITITSIKYEMIPVEYQAYIALAGGIANILLRHVTNTKINRVL